MLPDFWITFFIPAVFGFIVGVFASPFIFRSWNDIVRAFKEF